MKHFLLSEYGKELNIKWNWDSRLSSLNVGTDRSGTIRFRRLTVNGIVLTSYDTILSGHDSVALRFIRSIILGTWSRLSRAVVTVHSMHSLVGSPLLWPIPNSSSSYSSLPPINVCDALWLGLIWRLLECWKLTARSSIKKFVIFAILNVKLMRLLCGSTLY